VKALRLVGPGQLELVNVAPPEQGACALVAVDRGGICGSDVKIVRGQTVVAYPRVLGHELVGSVVEAGRDRRIPVGTRVMVDPFASCGQCTLCRADRANLCLSGSLMGREVDGGFAELVAVDEGRLVPIPDAVTRDDSVMSQVLGVCVHAQARVAVFPGQSAVVVGLGVGGLLHVQLLLARGVRTVVGVTRSAKKRELAEQLGATATCHPDVAATCVAELTAGRGADLVVESVGTVETLAQAIRLAGAGAAVLAYGTTRADHGQLEFVQLYQKELELISSRAALPRDYFAAMRLLASGTMTVAPLLSAVYPLDHAPEAFAAVQSQSDLVKVAIDLS
jgi:2-desacetyl-2-hydroxyethyl bacteriochlorophyllide A dehydrogenase